MKLARKPRCGAGEGPSGASSAAAGCRHIERMSRGGAIIQRSAPIPGLPANRAAGLISGFLARANGISLIERDKRDDTGATRRPDEAVVTIR
jgi:hypothetical protein